MSDQGDTYLDTALIGCAVVGSLLLMVAALPFFAIGYVAEALRKRLVP
jgi:hypothetical protein